MSIIHTTVDAKKLKSSTAPQQYQARYNHYAQMHSFAVGQCCPTFLKLRATCVLATRRQATTIEQHVLGYTLVIE